MDKSTLIDLIDHYFTSFLHERTKNKIGIAIDEASGLIKSFPGKFLSPNNNPRGLVAPFEDALSSLLPHVNYMTHSGTSFTIRQGQEILSSIGKKAVDLYNRFPYFQSIEEVIKFLEVFLNLKGCEPILRDKELMNKLVGRKRIAALMIKTLSKEITQSSLDFTSLTSDEERIEFKCKIFEESIHKTYKMMKDDIIYRINSNLNRTLTDETKKVEQILESTMRFTDAMKRLVSLSMMTCEPLIELNYLEQDIMDLGITNIEMTEKKAYRLQELLAYDVGLYYITNRKEQAIMESLTLTMHFDPKGQEKGYHFERLIYLELMNLTSIHSNLYDLPFLGDSCQDWMRNVEFQIEKFGTFRQLNKKSDLEVIREMVSGKLKNVLLKPSDDMGPDGLWISVQNGKLYFVVIAIKLYTSYSPEAQTKNQQQSNLGHVYMNKHHVVPPKHQQKHENFHDLFGGALKGHFRTEKRETRQSKPLMVSQEGKGVSSQLEVGGILRIHIQTPIIKREDILVHENESICNLDLNHLSTLITDSNLFEFLKSICK
jgi:hypothetical protein